MVSASVASEAPPLNQFLLQDATALVVSWASGALLGGAVVLCILQIACLVRFCQLGCMAEAQSLYYVYPALAADGPSAATVMLPKQRAAWAAGGVYCVDSA
jgi:hypothetical protein